MSLALSSSYGGPWTLAKHAYDELRVTGTGTSRPGADINQRLFSFAGNGRLDSWRAAWEDSRKHPWLGAGAGTFEQYWFRYRPYAAKARDAHSLRVETRAELGQMGVLLLAATLTLPLAAAMGARRAPLVPAVLGHTSRTSCMPASTGTGR